jgi:hypothetical protein
LNSQSIFPPDDDEDTIEIELTPKEMRRLSRAGRAARTFKGQYRLWSVPFAAALVGIVVGIAASNAWRPTRPHPVPQRIAPSPAPRSTPPTAVHPAVLAVPQAPQPLQLPQAAPDPPVRVKNPFDAHEVFEFPAGTTRAEARRKVSELLMQRAAERRAPAKGSEPAN